MISYLQCIDNAGLKRKKETTRFCKKSTILNNKCVMTFIRNTALFGLPEYGTFPFLRGLLHMSYHGFGFAQQPLNLF